MIPAASPDRPPPHSSEAEEHVIACCLLDDNQTVARCIKSGVTPDSFYFPANRLLFEIITELYGKGTAVMLETLAEELKTRRQLEAVGGFAYLMQVTGKIPTTAHAGYFIEKVREKHSLRRLIKAAAGAVEMAYKGELSDAIGLGRAVASCFESTDIGHDQLLILPTGDVSITGAAEKIFARIASAQNLFYRGGRVHEIAINADATKRLDPITPAQFRSRLETYGRVFAWRSGAKNDKVLKPTVCAEETAKALLESLPARNILPNVSVLSACPVLANTGHDMKLLGAGWHPEGGGIFITGGETPPKIPLAEAVAALCSLLDDFDFASKGDRSRSLASLIAPALRFGSWLANPLPVDIGEADSSQSGKTYRQKIVAAIYRETCNVVVQRAGGVGGLDESISQKLIDGRPFILLDNLRGKLDSPFMEAILTASGPMPARVPHRGEVLVDARGFVFQITSNGVETTRDLANRASIVRIRKRCAGFEFKRYPEGDLHVHVRARQAYYLGCVFSIIADWASKGQPRTHETRHDFREWAQALDWIVQNVFEAAPLMDGHSEASQRVSDPRRIWLRSLCIALRDAGRTGELMACQLAEFALENEKLPPGVGSDPDEATVSRRIGKEMAAVFGDSDSAEIDGFKIQRSSRYNATAGKSAHHYRFLNAA